MSRWCDTSFRETRFLHEREHQQKDIQRDEIVEATQVAACQTEEAQNNSVHKKGQTEGLFGENERQAPVSLRAMGPPAKVAHLADPAPSPGVKPLHLFPATA